MNIFGFQPNEPTGVRDLAGITASLNLAMLGDPNASVLLLLNGRDVLTAFPVALVVAPISISKSFMAWPAPLCADGAGLTGEISLSSQATE